MIWTKRPSLIAALEASPTCHGDALPNGCRATASALAGLLSNYLGGGLGALLLGMVSDVLTPSFGDTALRIALLIASAGIIVAAIFVLRASRSLPADAKL